MNTEMAAAQLALAKAEEAWAEAKKAGKKTKAYLKAEAVVVAARNEWRTNWREPHEDAAAPEPVAVKAEAK